MRRRILAVTMACVALGAWARVAAVTPPARGAAPALASPSPAAPADRAAPGADGARAPAATPTAAASPAPAVEKAGVALARSLRDDACACTTKACWRATSATYQASVGLVVPRSAEEGRHVDEAFREAVACLKRIYAAEAPDEAQAALLALTFRRGGQVDDAGPKAWRASATAASGRDSSNFAPRR